MRVRVRGERCCGAGKSEAHLLKAQHGGGGRGGRAVGGAAVGGALVPHVQRHVLACAARGHALATVSAPRPPTTACCRWR